MNAVTPPVPRGITDLAAVLEAAVDAVVAVDSDGTVRYANAAATRLFGPERTLLGAAFGHPVPVGEVSEIEVLAASGQRTVEMRASLLEVEGEAFAVAVLHDITDRIRTDRRLREAIRSREQVLAMAAHELRTPLTVVTGMAQTLAQSWDSIGPDERRTLVGRIAARSIDLQRLTERMLAASSADRWVADRAIVGLDGVLVRVAETFPAQDLRYPAHTGLEVHADDSQVAEMLVNLVENAVKYGEPPVEIAAAPLGDGRVEVRVRDHGSGVADVDLDGLFETGRGRDAAATGASGLGLGLNIVARLAEANDATVTYEDAPGGGACFVVRLPTAG